MGSIDTLGTVIDKNQYFPLYENSEKLSGNFEKNGTIWNNFRNILKHIGKNQKKMWPIFRTNFGSAAENITEILRKFLKFLNGFVQLFRILMLGDNVTWKLQGRAHQAKTQDTATVSRFFLEYLSVLCAKRNSKSSSTFIWIKFFCKGPSDLWKHVGKKRLFLINFSI